MSFEAVACPECFSNFGFRQTLTEFCHHVSGKCSQCGLVSRLKVDRDGLKQALRRFFVDGSYITGTYAPVYQIGELNPSRAALDPTLASDADLAGRLAGLVAFHYGPPTWRVGDTELRDEFEAGGELRHWAAADLVKAAESIILPANSRLFRLRLNPKVDESISTAAAFDPPPPTVQRSLGRWDDVDHPVLYASDDIELCLHECRITISDEIVVASMSPTRDLRILDLSSEIRWGSRTPFEDPNIFVGIMFRSRGRWLEYCRVISRVARDAGYDGIRYISYYAQAKHDLKSLNLALFGRPISDGMLRLESVNRLRIADVTYRFRFGPVLYHDSVSEADLNSKMESLRILAAAKSEGKPGGSLEN
jgi:hypothetical protein